MNSPHIVFWRRFIDDGIGIWKGSKDEFDTFLMSLNSETSKFRIRFPPKESQFGKTVNFLDLNLYYGEDNKIHHRLYTKPTDARAYLNPVASILNTYSSLSLSPK